MRQPLLIHPEFDGFDRIDHAYREVFVFIGFDERDEHFHLVRFRRSLLRLVHPLQPLECSAQVVVVTDQLIFIDGLHVDTVVLRMGAMNPAQHHPSLDFNSS